MNVTIFYSQMAFIKNPAMLFRLHSTSLRNNLSHSVAQRKADDQNGRSREQRCHSEAPYGVSHPATLYGKSSVKMKMKVSAKSDRYLSNLAKRISRPHDVGVTQLGQTIATIVSFDRLIGTCSETITRN